MADTPPDPAKAATAARTAPVKHAPPPRRPAPTGFSTAQLTKLSPGDRITKMQNLIKR